MRRDNSNFKTGFVSEAGSFVKNRDYFAYVELNNFMCWVIADGIDLDEDVVSAELVVQSVIDNFTKKPTMSKRILKQYVKDAHSLLLTHSNKTILKASITILVSDYVRVRWAKAGNSRFYLFRNNRVNVKSKDESLYQIMLDAGEIPENSEEGFEERGNLINYLGKASRLKVDVSKKIKLSEGDIMLLCTQGFWENVTDIEMIDTLEEVKDSEDAALNLEEVILSKQENNNYEVNNYTVAVITVDKLFKEVNRSKKIKKILLAILIPVLIFVILFSVYAFLRNKKQKEIYNSSNTHYQKAIELCEDESYQRALTEYEKAIEDANKLKLKKYNDYKENLDERENIVRLLVEAEDYFEKGKYDKAKQSYQKAAKILLKDTLKYEELDLDYIQEKIQECENYGEVNKLLKEGDMKVLAGNYDDAVSKYKDALLKSVVNSYAEGEKEAREKLEKSQLGKSEEDNSEREIEANALESAGNKALSQKKFDEAAQNFKMAGDIYNEIGQADKAASLQEKSTSAEKNQLDDKNSEKEKQALELEDKGNKALAEKDYDSAIEYFNLANDIYTEIGKTDKSAAMSQKIVSVEEKKTSKEKSDQKNEAAKIKKSGDEKLKNGDYSGAIEDYNSAKDIYEELDMSEKVTSLEKSIESAEKKLNGDSNVKSSSGSSSNSSNSSSSSSSDSSNDSETDSMIDELIEKAEEAYGDRDYKIALEYYKIIQAVYNALGDYKNANKVQIVINRLESLITDTSSSSLSSLTDVKKLDDIETIADYEVRNGNYDKALQYYNLLKVIYKDLNLSSKLTNVETKISNVQKLM